jgi:hypothetical protein
MVIYDFQNQDTINFSQILISLFLLALGLLFFFVFSKYKPEIKENFSIQFHRLSRTDQVEYLNITPKIFKMMGIVVFLSSIFILYTQFSNYFYVKNIRFFENTKSMTCRIDKTYRQNLFGSEYIAIAVKTKTFFIVKDSRYIANRNLLNNDSVTIEYFEKAVDLKHRKSLSTEVLKIEIK